MILALSSTSYPGIQSVNNIICIKGEILTSRFIHYVEEGRLRVCDGFGNTGDVFSYRSLISQNNAMLFFPNLMRINVM
jgi:hypothetical protein